MWNNPAKNVTHLISDMFGATTSHDLLFSCQYVPQPKRLGRHVIADGLDGYSGIIQLDTVGRNIIRSR